MNARTHTHRRRQCEVPFECMRVHRQSRRVAVVADRFIRLCMYFSIHVQQYNWIDDEFLHSGIGTIASNNITKNICEIITIICIYFSMTEHITFGRSCWEWTQVAEYIKFYFIYLFLLSVVICSAISLRNSIAIAHSVYSTINLPFPLFHSHPHTHIHTQPNGGRQFKCGWQIICWTLI